MTSAHTVEEMKMKASDIMTPSPECCSSNDSIQAVAAAMRDDDCGAIPIVDNGKLVGIVTDRDLCVRVLANGLGPDAKVGQYISRDPQCCDADDDIQEVQRVMADSQVRRVPILDASGNCVGIVSQADLARAAGANAPVTEREVAIVVERISQPSSSNDLRDRSHRDRSLPFDAGSGLGGHF
jgi:CBS domain-containing protein